MSKGKNRGTGYNRQSGGYQRNMQRHYMNQEGISMPKTMEPKKFRIMAICAAVIWVIACVLLFVALRWIGLAIGIVIGIAGVAGVFFYLRRKQNEVLSFYKKMGMTEAMYMDQMKRRDADPKHLDAYRRAWRKMK